MKNEQAVKDKLAEVLAWRTAVNQQIVGITSNTSNPKLVETALPSLQQQWQKHNNWIECLNFILKNDKNENQIQAPDCGCNKA